MRLVLVGPKSARDRLRPDLIAAGFEIVSELGARPADGRIDGIDGIDGFDAIVEARAELLPTGRDADSGIVTEALTPREFDVLAHMAEGLSNKAIAVALGISDQTVKFHVAAIIGKLGANNRTDAVRRAIRQGLVAI